MYQCDQCPAKYEDKEKIYNCEVCDMKICDHCSYNCQSCSIDLCNDCVIFQEQDYLCESCTKEIEK